MPSRDDDLAWIALTRTPGLSVPMLSTALETLGQASGLVRAPDHLRLRAGLPAEAGRHLRAAAATPAELAWLDNPRHRVLPFTDPHFPQLLRALPDCPIALYVDGDAGILGDPQLAIVGSRNPTPQGRETAFEFAEYLAGVGLTITSGVAEGIDSQAHRGALAGGGFTVGVLGSGVDVIYPRGNRDLFAEIAGHGALVSELPLGAPPRREHFPRRNRLIAALSLGTLVVEAAARSGSLVTARHAGDYGREVFAIPGSIHNPMARGCHQLIRQGAKLTESAPDILAELNFSAFLGTRPAAGAAHAPRPFPDAGMDKDHKILLDALGFDPTDLDALVVRTGFKPEALSSMMLILELEGHVQAAPGGRYSRVARS
jgi:DNA processing protein